MQSFKRIRDLLKLGGSGGIAKRYMVMNSFDGSLTALGIILGGWLVPVNDARVVIVAGLGASIAMGVSGAFGAFLTESAVKKEEMAEIESAMLEELENTVHSRAAAWSSLFVAAVDGISPFLAASISFLPFIAGLLLVWDIQISYIISIFLTAVSLFILGAYLGRISGENIANYGFKMIIAGIVTGILVFIVEALSHG
ncbi:MAG: hypothetical protein ACFFE8_04185 [Candidatus Heimdallarchaeota archaeon]